MAKLPVVQGLLKHQLYLNDPLTGREQQTVITFWTWRNEHPASAPRIAHEQGQIVAVATQAAFRATIPTAVKATWLKTWDFGFAPPLRLTPVRIWPQAAGTYGSAYITNLSTVVALRTQPTGSQVRNRLNGRLHAPFPNASQIADGRYVVGWRNIVLAGYDPFRTVLKPSANAASGTWVVPCFFEAGALRPGGPQLPAVDHLIIRSEPGVTRSRLHRPGPYARGA